MGLISYLAVFGNVMKEIYIKMKINNGYMYAFVLSYIMGYLITCIADNLLYYLVLNWYFWFFIGTVIKTIPREQIQKG